MYFLTIFIFVVPLCEILCDEKQYMLIVVDESCANAILPLLVIFKLY